MDKGIYYSSLQSWRPESTENAPWRVTIKPQDKRSIIKEVIWNIRVCKVNQYNNTCSSEKLESAGGQEFK